MSRQLQLQILLVEIEPWLVQILKMLLLNESMI